MLDPTYETPQRGDYALHMQVRQHSVEPITLSPALSLQAASSTDKNAPLRLSLKILTDASVDSTGRITSPSPDIFSFPVDRGVWHTYVFQLIPSYLGDGRVGRIALWIEGNLAFKYVGDWGFKPASLGGLLGVGEAFDIRVGTYRTRSTRHALLYLDNVRYGAGFGSVSSVPSTTIGTVVVQGKGN